MGYINNDAYKSIVIRKPLAQLSPLSIAMMLVYPRDTVTPFSTNTSVSTEYVAQLTTAVSDIGFNVFDSMGNVVAEMSLFSEFL